MRILPSCKHLLAFFVVLLIVACAGGPEFDPAESFDVVYPQAVEELRQGDLEAAERGFQLALQKNPRNAVCH